jgi:ubiquitin C-terminal hydrolase
MRPDWYYEVSSRTIVTNTGCTHGLPCCQYELRGIVAHVGTADSGHYYSFIKEREGKHDGQWFEFNDRIVAPFSPEKIPEECYGGTYSVDVRVVADCWRF